MPPNPNVGAWVGAISAVRAGVSGAVFSAPTLALDTASFTISYDTTGPGGVPQIKIIANPAAAPTFTDITARSLVLGVGYSGQTNLDVTGASLLRGPVTLSDTAALTKYLDIATIAEPADPLTGKIRLFFVGTQLRMRFYGGISKTLYPWPALPTNVPPVVTGADVEYVIASGGELNSLGTRIAAVWFRPSQTIAASATHYVSFTVGTCDGATGTVTPFAADLDVVDTQAGMTAGVRYRLWAPAAPIVLDDGSDLVIQLVGSGTSPLTKPSTVLTMPG